MIFEDRILRNPRLLRLKNPSTNEVINFEVQDYEASEIVQEGTEVNAEVMNNLIQNPVVSDAYDPTQTYAIGDYCIYNNTLYRCTGTTTGTWDSSKWSATKISDNLNIVGVSKTEPAEKVWIKKGNNLFNSKLRKGLWTDTSNKIANNNSGFYTVVKIDGGKTYTISKKNSTGSIYCATTSVYPQKNVPQINVWQGNDGITTLTIETSITAKYLFIGLFGGNPTAEQKNECIEELMINQGSTALPYEPYVSKEIQIRNSNNVFEEFYNEENFIRKTSEVTFRAGMTSLINWAHINKVGKIVTINAVFVTAQQINAWTNFADVPAEYKPDPSQHGVRCLALSQDGTPYVIQIVENDGSIGTLNNSIPANARIAITCTYIAE